jgi:hypothetical protein
MSALFQSLSIGGSSREGLMGGGLPLLLEKFVKIIGKLSKISDTVGILFKSIRKQLHTNVLIYDKLYVNVETI